MTRPCWRCSARSSPPTAPAAGARSRPCSSSLPSFRKRQKGSVLDALAVLPRRLPRIVEEMPVEVGQVGEPHFVADLRNGLIRALQQATSMGQAQLAHQVAEVLAGGSLE